MIKFDGLNLNTSLLDFEIINENKFGTSNFILNNIDNEIDFTKIFREDDFNFLNNEISNAQNFLNSEIKQIEQIQKKKQEDYNDDI